MIALLLPHTGAHVAPHAAVLPALPLIFRRAVAAVRRKQAAPETPRPSGAATVTMSAERVYSGELVSDRYACCPCCVTGSPCEPPNMHLAPCGDGCNDPVLGDRMISDVRAEYDWLTDLELASLRTRRARQHADAMHAGYARAVDRLRADAGLPTADEMREEYFALPRRDRRPNKQPWETAAFPVYGQAPVTDVLEAERLAKGLLA